VGAPGHVALTFDDGPDPESTPAILDALDALGWKATFFWLGSQAAKSPGLAREVAGRGHEIGAHGYEHRSHLRRTAAWAVRDLHRAEETIAEVTGRPVVWFRPPYGAVSASTLAAARARGLRLVLWTTWGKDWESSATAESVVGWVARTYRPGATVLLHDSDVTSTPGSWKATLAALPILADSWRSEGLTVGPLADHGLRVSSARARPGK
jgi:peptidoglycan/xylan/chitin deacetylase (PgdA/CDA1 family)